MYAVILFREAYLIRLVINFGHYFDRDITRCQFAAVFKPEVFGG